MPGIHKQISFFGYGKTTRALAKKLGPSTFYDDNVSKPHTDDEGNSLKPSSEFVAKYSQCEIPSPGMAPSHPLIQQANNLISEYDYFADTMPPSVWISGTNGKTTTTQMIQTLLSSHGSLAGGNIGTPLAELDLEASLWILETSSFTLHYTNKAVPQIYVLLPITPDHLYWHGSMSEYEEAKLKPLSAMSEGDAVLIPKKYKDYPTKAMKIPYDTNEDLAEYFDIDISKLRFKGAFLQDALLALSVSKILFDECDYERINAMPLDAHRQEELYDKNGRLWVNDSKATNLDATIQAVMAYKHEPLSLILGGDDKGVDLRPLFELLAGIEVTIYTIGKNESKLLELAKDFVINAHGCHTLENACKKIIHSYDTISTVLLSPAAASLDQFSSYGQRGDEFKKFVKL
ncbi:UDP-N-acetylmuramoyl-L-alanine--D-glutamate ligase [Sulfurimonas sp. MAG313]|nr:UDP-N-acetylmuramoyl-L-alanine--D-glutamate ligase [Sulfurimonas sp. MAG313]MDF1880739.1 UDP-N-acetylmuramoyl-L-alanine--D-glutamate ligase [Sulfurimonas sp. MAG313]